MNKTPEAYITVSKSRRKIYNKDIYLADGTEFEIELYNPSTTKLLAKITLNGNPISSSGIILKPGERVFLERYLDKPNKFKFETYDVEDSEASKEAIQHNGKLKVDFFEENHGWTYYNANRTFTINTPYTYFDDIITASDYNYKVNEPVTSCASVDYINLTASNTTSRKIDTGRVEAGDNSDQRFITVAADFYMYASYTIEYIIKPVSAKPIETNDIRNYCSECGIRLRSNWTYCSKCGNKI